MSQDKRYPEAEDCFATHTRLSLVFYCGGYAPGEVRIVETAPCGKRTGIICTLPVSRQEDLPKFAEIFKQEAARRIPHEYAGNAADRGHIRAAADLARGYVTAFPARSASPENRP